ncbi:MAG: D-glycerate dehydrogenase [Candidatus Heimdallarchaeota archaeon]|nr:D-glycerate dehydrogenase [Candidatus Heimdallarchaeota archaeon]
MTNYNVLVTRKLPQKAFDFLEKKGVKLEINPKDEVMPHDEIVQRVKGKDGLLCLLTDRIDAEIMDAGKDTLKMIANYAVGYNNIDIDAANARGIPVSNTPGVLTETTADLAFTLLLAIARRIVESDRFVRAGNFKGWGPLLQLGQDIYQKTLGIIGCGRIGSAVAYRAVKGFKMRVLYYDSDRKPKLEEELGLEYCSLEALLKEADFISLHVPLTDTTKHMIDAKELSLMKPSACLINTSRGAVINEEALVDCLQNKGIFGAALDVYEYEPKLTNGLEKLDNVILTAHIGSASIETRTKMAMIAAENLIAGMEGRRPENCVNPEVLE